MLIIFNCCHVSHGNQKISFDVAKMIVKILKEIEQDDFKILRDAIDWNNRWTYHSLILFV
jgi:hypothetical protein